MLDNSQEVVQPSTQEKSRMEMAERPGLPVNGGWDHVGSWQRVIQCCARAVILPTLKKNIT